MMRALVVYESMFGNTKQVAEEICRGLAEHVDTLLEEVGTAPERPDGDIGLVVIGGPTHAFGLSSARTRDSAAQQAHGPVVSTGDGIREWIAKLHVSSPMPLVATFDTHSDHRWVPGSAAVKADGELEAFGFEHLAEPISFYVEGTPGPLVDGELKRARAWGSTLGAGLVSRMAVVGR